MKLEVMSAKTMARIGFWNVRTMYETGKLAQVTAEMRWYNLHVLVVSESRWIDREIKDGVRRDGIIFWVGR